MFWGLVLRSNKRYSQTVSKTFHLSQASLDLGQTPDDKDVQVQVTLTADNENYILCTLDRKNNLQARLDLVFSEGDDIAFSCIGGSVHLTGYLVPDDDNFDFEGADDEESDLENELPVVAEKSLKKAKKVIEKQESEEEDGDSETGENGLVSDDEVSELEEAENDDDDDDDDDDEEDDEQDEDDEDNDSDEEILEPAPKKMKQPNGVVANGKAEKKQKDIKKDVATASAKHEKQVKEPKSVGVTKNFPSGLKIEDIRVGKGPEAKAGKRVQVYYEGRLQSNNKTFDSSKSGQGFQFQLGRGEVIRGWDMGVVGMKVGSKRRITCPPALAYGAKGSPPVIPGNATLVFDVELRNVK